MQIIRYPDRTTPAGKSAVAIGNFDGLHRGHQAVIARMKAIAAEHDFIPSVLTFEPHPRLFFAPHTPPFRIEPLATKLARLRDAGVKQVMIPRFDANFAALSAERFLSSVLGAQLKAGAVVTGDNFAFGQGRTGDVAMLKQWGSAHGVIVDTVPPAKLEDGSMCSSSAVRQALGEGDMLRAARLLGRPYCIKGRVMHGDARGRELGFPTANLHLPRGLKLPDFGVYAVRAQVHGSAVYANRRFEGVANFGHRPTIARGLVQSFEVHLFDFTGELYGATLDVAMIGRLREEKRFDSLAALTHQIAEDVLAARALLALEPAHG